MGLLLPHIFTACVYPDMVSLSLSHKTNHTGGGKRNEIRGFSKESRYRLFRLLHSIQFERFSFVTLTYGPNFPTDPRIAKKHLQTFRRYTEKRWGSIPAIWRIEKQKRGAFHYHILYFDPPFIPVQDWETTWHKSRGVYGLDGNRNSLDLKCNRGIANARRVSYYVGKYISKVDPGDIRQDKGGYGRIWGKWNLRDPDPIKIRLYEVEKRSLEKMLFESRGNNEYTPGDIDNFTLFGTKMGTSEFQSEILRMIARVMEHRLRTEKTNRIFDTSNLVLTALQ